MKTLAVRFALAMSVLWCTVIIVYDFFANETIHYYSTRPHHLLYVAAGAVLGTLAVWAFDRLPRRAKRRVILLLWGAAASTPTLYAIFLGYMLSMLAQLWWRTCDHVSLGDWIPLSCLGLLFGVLLSSAVAIFLWFKLYRAWKTGILPPALALPNQSGTLRTPQDGTGV